MQRDPARLAPTTIVALCNQKGGVGKTRLALGLAEHTAAVNGRALVVDVDPQANAHDLAAETQNKGYEVVHELDPTQLGALAEVRMYDTIFVDCPGSLEGQDVLREVLRHSTVALIPFDDEKPSREPTKNTINYVKKLSTPYRVVLNKMSPLRGGGPTLKAIERLDEWKAERMRCVIRQYQAWSASLDAGLPITRYRGGNASEARSDLASLHTELLFTLGRLERERAGA